MTASSLAKVLHFAAFLTCILLLPADDKQPQPAVRVELVLRDTSRLNGVPTVKQFPFRSSLARMEVPLTGLRNVEFKDDRKTAVLYFRNGDRLEGVFDLKTFGVETRYGKLEVQLQEIVSIRVSGSPGGSVPAEGLMGHWPLDGNADDISGNGHHGKIMGAKVTKGVSGEAYHFDGSAGIDLGPLVFSSERFTVSGWIRTDEPARTEDWKTWIDKMDESGGPFELGLGDGRPEGGVNGPQALVWNGSRGEVNLISNNTKLNLYDGRWHMYSFTYQKGSQKLYIDGKLFVSGTFSGRLPSNSASVMIGGRHFGPYHHPWIGDVDEVFIYNRALTAEEVTQLFQAHHPANATD